MNIRKKETLIFAAILIAALAAWGILYFNRTTKDYGSVTITVDGKEYGTYTLDKDQKIKINDTNTLRIKDHEAKMIEANCPDHLCIHQSAIDERGGMIVCLPNEVIVEGKPSAAATSSGDVLDAVAN